MDEKTFETLANRMLAQIEAALESAALDVETKPGGVLEVSFDNDTKIIINRHGAAREIWVAARSGGYHFKPEADGRWLSGRDGSELMATLARCCSEQAEQPIRL